MPQSLQNCNVLQAKFFGDAIFRFARFEIVCLEGLSWLDDNKVMVNL